MITAKDEFIMEREMLAQAQSLIYRSNLSPDEKDELAYQLDNMSEGQWDELQKKLKDNQITPLNKLKNGELLKMSELNIACRKAVDHG